MNSRLTMIIPLTDMKERLPLLFRQTPITLCGTLPSWPSSRALTAASYAASDLASSSAPAEPQDAQAAASAAATPVPAPAAAPAPLSTFVLTGPLQWLPPATFDAGPLGKLSVNGIVTGFAQFQNNSVPGDDDAQATLSNGQIFIQKADGKASVVRPGGRLHHADAQRAVC